MEVVLETKEMDPETLISETPSFSYFSSFIPSRRHLDSASYRSLIRIFSHCLDLSPVSPQLHTKDSNSDPGEILSGKYPASDTDRDEFSVKCEGRVGHLVGNSAERRGEVEGRANGGGKEGLASSRTNLVDLDLGSFCPLEEKEIEKCVSSELVSSFMSDCSRLIKAPEAYHLRGASQEGKGLDGHDEDYDLTIKQTRIDGSLDRICHTGEISAIGNEYELGEFELNVLRDRVRSNSKDLDGGSRGAEVLGELNSKNVDDIYTDKPLLVEVDDGNSNAVEEEESIKQQKDVHPSVDSLGSRNLKVINLSSLSHATDDEDFEEGQIPDDIKDLADSEDNASAGTVLEDQNKDGPKMINDITSGIIVHDKCKEIKHATLVKLSTLGLNQFDAIYEAGLPNASEEDLKDTAVPNKQKVVEVREKRKPTPLTEERKAKRKITKKRKRAQKNREQGVKRLKLHAISKPKEVKLCNFYLKGRCQQGDLCKFSHDTTPLTKSMPCKYFACNSCLKGDDCPFDHELSKYPCHNYISTGGCIRGDKCKFSHKIPTTDASSQALTDNVCSLLTSETSETSTSKNHSVKRNAFLSGLPEGTKSTSSEVHKPLNETIRVPKGIRFLSFGNPSKVKETMLVNKPGHEVNNQKQDISFSLSARYNFSSGVTIKESENIIKGASVISPGGTLNHEVSEATKILEEFLFCG